MLSQTVQRTSLIAPEKRRKQRRGVWPGNRHERRSKKYEDHDSHKIVVPDDGQSPAIDIQCEEDSVASTRQRRVKSAETHKASQGPDSRSHPDSACHSDDILIGMERCDHLGRVLHLLMRRVPLNVVARRGSLVMI